MSRPLRRTSLIIGLAVAVMALGVAVAIGHERLYKLKPKPTISYTDSDRGVDGDPVDFFAGDLVYKERTPGGANCLGDRTLSVYSSPPLVKIGETQTADDGSWKLEAEDVANGEYHAHVRKKFLKVTIPPGPGFGGHIHKFRCLPAKSVTITAKP